MATSSSGPPILEGVFAISKPPGISSAQVIRDVQHHFNPSALFRPWLDRERERRQKESNYQRKRRTPAKREQNVKIGHGGTLDPMATGVLILGIGTGTKALAHFMTECTKSYEAVLLFGTATDTYDTQGKIVARKPFDHITRESVEAALAQFRGRRMQKPPIYSALRVQGKRMYEYAREGKELPIEIKERPVDASKLELVEWMDGGTHSWHWPQEEAEKGEMQVAQKALHLDEIRSPVVPDSAESGKRKREDGQTEADAQIEEPQDKRAKNDESNADMENAAPEPVTSTNSEAQKATAAGLSRSRDEIEPSEASASTDTRKPCPAPACRIQMTVTSGFYVRSLCHDLGAAVDSLGIMASLVRTQQGRFELDTNVLPYEDLKEGEDVWGPKVKSMLEDWQEHESAKDEA